MESEDRQPSRLSTAHSRELGEELRRVRHRARMSSGEIAETLGWSVGKLSKLETGSRGTSPWEIAALLGRCAADKPSRDRIMAIAGENDTGSFLRLHTGSVDTLTALAVHERTARTITAYEPLCIPGLAQTGDYALAWTGDTTVADARMNRQRHLAHVTSVFYLHEAALHLVVGSPEVMRDQLLRLTLMCGWPTTTLRVIRTATPAHVALQHPGTLLTFDAPTRPVAYVETDTATVFHDHACAVARYERKMRHLDALALTVEESRDVLARWADAYDRRAA